MAATMVSSSRIQSAYFIQSSRRSSRSFLWRPSHLRQKPLRVYRQARNRKRPRATRRCRRVYEETIRQISDSGALEGRDLGAVWNTVRDYWQRLSEAKALSARPSHARHESQHPQVPAGSPNGAIRAWRQWRRARSRRRANPSASITTKMATRSWSDQTPIAPLLDEEIPSFSVDEGAGCDEASLLLAVERIDQPEQTSSSKRWARRMRSGYRPRRYRSIAGARTAAGAFDIWRSRPAAAREREDDFYG